ncbi:polyprenyl diphosphate synthase [Nocardia ninae]|uniref:Isoprenyl transferase n=1 Tax=Nocardia ninae NBRC 108245 TaxID=1210091 RepID=A0A511MCW8_9NOCA|nr:polyprenyl diphosphate synthase [Nocardia ninae]GEM38513.1 short-chain Z-isoprenyl diphosphate synthase [Nocardia ninae NBRC 108245]
MSDYSVDGQSADVSIVPTHVGFILDGNRRWAHSRGMKASAGHLAGFSRIPEVLTWCRAVGIQAVTLWMLSTDNLKRSPVEVDSLVKIIEATVKTVSASEIGQIRHIGSRSAVRKPLLDIIDRAVEQTAETQGMRINLGVCYGGREEIIDACRSILARCVADGMSIPEAIDRVTVSSISQEILAGSIAPELIVRTSGEQRSSGFMLWSGMYSTMCIVPAYWPDFRFADFREVLLAYREADRETRYADSGEPCEVSVR